MMIKIIGQYVRHNSNNLYTFRVSLSFFYFSFLSFLWLDQTPSQLSLGQTPEVELRTHGNPKNTG